MTGALLRITHVVNTDHFAGIERYVVDVSIELARRGHNVRIAGGEPAAMTALLPNAVGWTPGASTRESLSSLLRGGRRDIVHSHITKADFVGLMAAPVTRAARVSTRHITSPRGYTTLARRLATVVRSQLACEIAVSAWTSEQLDRPADVVLLNGVPVNPDVSTQRERIVLVAQRLTVEKDTQCALEAWARSGLAANGWRMVIAGRGVLGDELQQHAVALGIADSVDFVGFLEDPVPLFRSASMLLAPPPTEPCGLTILEAMSHGLPVVAAGSGGHAETVGTCEGAALFPPGDADAAAAQLARLATDEAERSAYGVRLRELQRTRFSIEAHVDRLEDLYRRLHDPPGPDSS